MTQPGFAGVRRIVDINANTGAFIAILATTTCRRLVIEESTITSAGAANTLQGLIQYKLPNDDTAAGFTTIFQAVGGQTTAAEGTVVPPKIELGNPVGQFGMAGEIIGQLGQPLVGLPGAPLPATTMIQLRSGTGTGTSVIVTEYN